MERSFKDVIRRRLNKKAFPAWALLVVSTFVGAWKVLDVVAQVQWIAGAASTAWPYVEWLLRFLWSYGWIGGLPAGFYWLYKADQPIEPPKRLYTLQQQASRERIAELLPHLPERSVDVLGYLIRGPQIIDTSYRFGGGVHLRPLRENDMILTVDETVGNVEQALCKINPLFDDLVQKYVRSVTPPEADTEADQSPPSESEGPGT